MDLSLLHDILDYIKESSAPVSKRELAASFSLKGQRRLILKAALKQLLNENKIAKYNGKFRLPKLQDTLPKKPSKTERPTDLIMGLIEQEETGLFLLPCDRRLRLRIPIAGIHLNKLKNGQIVRAHVHKRGRMFTAEIKAVLGSVTDPGIFSQIAIHDFKLRERFSAAAVAQAEGASVPPLKGREDLRNICLVTIDDETARDFDDAVWAESDPDPANPGGWHVIVAIADVAHYVRPDSALDQAARERGNSVYLPDQVLPMLPEGLSNDMCSLRPQEERACLAVHLYFNGNGNMVHYRFCRGIMRSHGRLTYNQVQGIIDGSVRTPVAGISKKFIQTLYSAYQALRSARNIRGALDLDMPEKKLVVDTKGHFQQIGVRERLPAHELIEEFMVAANVAAARFLENKRLPLLYRAHDKPSVDKLSALQAFLKRTSINAKLEETVTPHTLNTIIVQSKNTPYAQVIQDLILRSQAQACYTPGNIGHYGLGLEKYCHFTSPIRRYADLIVHRAILQGLGIKGDEVSTDKDTQNFQELGQHLSDCERRATQAERDTQDRYLSQYLQGKTGEIFNVVVTGVAKFGLFVTIQTLNATGILLAANLPGDYYAYDEKNMRLVGRRGKKKYELGQSLQAKLIKAEPHTGSLEFMI